MKRLDAHLDMSMNALDHERDQRLPVAAIREREAEAAQLPKTLASYC